MNALIPIARKNACPPAYRDLSPKEECRLRSKRLGGTERPGALPKCEPHEIAMARAAARREIVLAKIAEGFNTPARLRTALNAVNWVDATVGSLVVMGAIESTRAHNGRTGGVVIYRVVSA